MIKISTHEEPLDEVIVNRASWWNNIWNEYRNSDDGIHDILDSMAKDWNGEWVHERRDGDTISIFPTHLVFKDDSSATLFLLRWM